MRGRLAIGLLFATLMLVYANALVDGFTLDDGEYITGNPQVTSPSLQSIFAPHPFTKVFRPLTFATLAMNWRWSGEHPFGYHFFNLLLHGAVTILLYFVLLGVLGETPTAQIVSLMAAWLFAVHPIHTEAVTSIVGVSELLAAGFLLGAWLLHLRDRPAWALACFGLALLSKESAVVFLGLVLVGDYAREQWKPRLRYAAIFVVTLLYVVLLWKVQGGHFGKAGIHEVDNPLATFPAQWRILNALRVAWKYVGLQVYPAKLSYDYSFNQILLYWNWRHTLLPAVAWAAVVAAWAWAIVKRNTGLVLAGGIYFAAFAATSNILVPIGTIMGERLAYLPSAGFCLLVALALNWLRERQRLVATGILTCVMAALAIRTFVRNLDWKNNDKLYAAAVLAAPGSAKVHLNLSAVYMNAGKLDLASKEVQEALRIYPDDPSALENYGLIECRRGNLQAGSRLLGKALNMSSRAEEPLYDVMAVNYAESLMGMARWDEALRVLNREIAESPLYARAWSNRAAIYYERGETEVARADATAALRLDPGNAQAKEVLQSLSGPSPKKGS